ncbi:hypothetical protein [Metallosphaera hakonensis]|uniref:hypothetical protein n=1 Tax=Metallosphaera hakonensis TaxID=79601 RepID=UPI000AC92EA0|nr:hypothetical protein [Metallosphaera hakonensis]
MQLAIRYSIVVAITLAEITIGEFFERGSPLNQLINSLLFASLLFIDGVISPLILDSLISSAAFSMSILMFLLLAGSSDPYLLLDYISGVGVSFFSNVFDKVDLG